MGMTFRRTAGLLLIGGVSHLHPAAAYMKAPTLGAGVLVYTQYGIQFKTHSVTGRHLNAFDVTRAYINIVGKFTIGVGTRITPDIYRNTTDGSLPSGSSTPTPPGPRRTAPSPSSSADPHPWLDWEEALWDYRMQGTMALERFGARPRRLSVVLRSGRRHRRKDRLRQGELPDRRVRRRDLQQARGRRPQGCRGPRSVRVLETDDFSRVGGLRITGYAGLGKPTGGGVATATSAWSPTSPNCSPWPESSAGPATGWTIRASHRHTGTGRRSRTDSDVLSFFGVLTCPTARSASSAAVRPAEAQRGRERQQPANGFIAGVSYQLTPNVRVLADVDNFWSQPGIYTNAVELHPDHTGSSRCSSTSSRSHR